MPPNVYTDDEIRHLLAACEGHTFEDRRDMTIVRLFFDTGMRLAELVGLGLVDVDLEQNIALVLGKGRRQRACPFGRRTAQALDRYLRARASHRDVEGAAADPVERPPGRFSHARSADRLAAKGWPSGRTIRSLVVGT